MKVHVLPFATDQTGLQQQYHRIQQSRAIVMSSSPVVESLTNIPRLTMAYSFSSASKSSVSRSRTDGIIDAAKGSKRRRKIWLSCNRTARHIVNNSVQNALLKN